MVKEKLAKFRAVQVFSSYRVYMPTPKNAKKKHGVEPTALVSSYYSPSGYVFRHNATHLQNFRAKGNNRGNPRYFYEIIKKVTFLFSFFEG